MTRDSGRHAQRGDVQQAPPVGCQSAIAQRIPTSPPIGTDEQRKQLRANITERYSKSLEFLSDDTTTDEELIAKLRGRLLYGEIATTCRQAANALQSRISEVERLSGDWFDKAIRDHCDEHGPSGGAWNISMVLERLHRARAALSQHGKV